MGRQTDQLAVIPYRNYLVVGPPRGTITLVPYATSRVSPFVFHTIDFYATELCVTPVSPQNYHKSEKTTTESRTATEVLSLFRVF